MTVLGDVTLGFLIESLLLAGFWAALAALAAAGALAATGGIPLRLAALRGPLLWAFLAAMTASSLAHRFGAPDLLLGIGRRRVPVLWSVGAAVVGAVAAVLMRRRSRSAPA